MRRIVIAVALVCLAALGGPIPAAGKSAVSLSAAPNPAAVGQRVVHTVDVAVSGSLQVWVSAAGFAQPRLGTLPPGTWVQTCCPPQTAGTPAWYFRSSGWAPSGTYRFGADARRVGAYLSTASAAFASAGVWIRVR